MDTNAARFCICAHLLSTVFLLVIHFYYYCFSVIDPASGEYLSCRSSSPAPHQVVATRQPEPFALLMTVAENQPDTPNMSLAGCEVFGSNLKTGAAPTLQKLIRCRP